MKTGTYIDYLQTKDMIKAENKKYIGYSYLDLFCDEWVGNINIVDKATNKSLFHATLERVMTQEELQESIDTHDKFIKILRR